MNEFQVTDRAELRAFVEQQHQAERNGAPRNGSTVEQAVHMEADARGNVTDKSSSGWVSRQSDAGGVIGTARSSTGRSLLPHEIKADSIVVAGGHPMTALQAFENGFLHRQPDGSFIEAGGGNGNPPPKPKANPFTAMQDDQQEPEEHQDDDTQSTEDPAALRQTAEAIEFFNTKVEPAAMTQAIDDAISGRGISLRAVHETAGKLGIQPEALQERISALWDHYSTQASAAVQKLGIVPGQGTELFFAWAQTANPEALQDAMRRHVGQQDLSGYRELARLFLQSVKRR